MTDKELAEYILDMFRVTKCRAGHIVMMRTFKQKVQSLNPKEQERIVDVANTLIGNGYFTYEDGSNGIANLRLTQKGYDYIYDEGKPLDGIDIIEHSTTMILETKPEEITVELVKQLEKQYLSAINSGHDAYNTHTAIDAFSNWFRMLLVLLNRHYDDSNSDFKYIKEQNVGGNGYSKHNVYGDIQAKAALLLDKIEYNQKKMETSIKVSEPNVVSLKSRIPMATKPIYKVFVSSTFVDLQEERIKAMTTIVQCGHLPIGMEQFPAAPIEAFEYIKMLIDNADYYLLLLAGKYGSIYKPTGKSFTQMEYEYAREKGVPIIFLTYHDVNKLPFDKCEPEAHVRELLEKFREEAGTGRLRQTWSTLDNLALQVKNSLENTIELYPRTGWVRADAFDASNTKDDAPNVNLEETITIVPVENPFAEVQPEPQTYKISDIILALGSCLKEYAQISQMKNSLNRLAEMSYETINDIIDRLLYCKLIERGEINNEYEGTYKVWSFTAKGLELYLKLKNE